MSIKDESPKAPRCERLGSKAREAYRLLSEIKGDPELDLSAEAAVGHAMLSVQEVLAHT